MPFFGDISDIEAFPAFDVSQQQHCLFDATIQSTDFTAGLWRQCGKYIARSDSASNVHTEAFLVADRAIFAMSPLLVGLSDAKRGKGIPFAGRRLKICKSGVLMQMVLDQYKFVLA